MKTAAKLFKSLPRATTVLPVATAVFFLPAAMALADNPNSIIYSKHNLAVSGPGSVRSSTEADVCIFCHTPHNASTEGPLWNHETSVASYTPYTSTTLKAAPGQPSGSSKLCLSCHDGTVALGAVYSRPAGIPMLSPIPPGRTLLGTDLSAHHPVSFTYDSALVAAQGELRDPDTLNQEVRLENDQVQCTSCHDAHNNQYGNFLVKDNTASAICRDCHAPNNWSASAHANSTAVWNGTAPNPWPHTTNITVAANACENCHRPHAAETPGRLLNFTPVEQNCLSCHNGNVAAKNISAELSKASFHPIFTTTGIHDPTEDIMDSTRHVACEDCHNPHAAKDAAASAPAASGALTGVRGVNAAGSEVLNVQFEYEACFRCHGDSGNRGPSRVQRQFEETNTRLEFSLGNTSFHPVEGVGKNGSVPSLITPWAVSSLTYCTDCHNNDQGPGAGGTGPKGPHGSAYTPLLERELLLTDGTTYNPNNFALCYKCHDEAVVNAPTNAPSGSWQYHRTHIENYKAACTTCHDSHAATQPHLINFNTSYVSTFGGVINYTSTGVNQGTCTLTCHDGGSGTTTHNARSY